jgi:hypothetical protein
LTGPNSFLIHFARSTDIGSDILSTIGGLDLNTRRLSTIFFVVGNLLIASDVRAQAGAPTMVQFSFSNPGARSLGFGGAFVALADDATAAFANPAGLVQLSRPEVSVEGKLWYFSTPFTEGGRLSGLPGILLDTTIVRGPFLIPTHRTAPFCPQAQPL